MHFIIPTVHLLIGAVLSFLQCTVKTAFAHLPEMSLQFDGSSSVVFFLPFSSWRNAVEGGKCPSVHTQILDRFECATKVFPVHCVLGHSPSALKKVSVSIEV